jgi:hypothetical protein
LLSQLQSVLLLQRGIADLLCDAAALPGRFLPELGRSALRSGHFSFETSRLPVDSHLRPVTMRPSQGGRHVKYAIDFRYLPKGADKPIDNTNPVDVQVDETQFALIPAVGDHVDMPGDGPAMRNVPLKGRVRSRMFRYVLGVCYVTVVVEDSDEGWAKLGKV